MNRQFDSTVSLLQRARNDTDANKQWARKQIEFLERQVAVMRAHAARCRKGVARSKIEETAEDMEQVVNGIRERFGLLQVQQKGETRTEVVEEDMFAHRRYRRTTS